MNITVKEAAELVGGKIFGNENLVFSSVAKIEKAETGDLTFLYHPTFEKFLEHTGASVILINTKIKKNRKDITYIEVEYPKFAFQKIIETYFAYVQNLKNIDESSFLSETAKLGNNVSIGKNVVISDGCEIGDNAKIFHNTILMDNVKIGSNCLFFPNITIRENCIIGDNVILHAGVVIGSDGFGYLNNSERKYIKIPQIGNVVIENDVEIGANTTVDRAALGSTIIKSGTKIDNLVQIAHNVEIGTDADITTADMSGASIDLSDDADGTVSLAVGCSDSYGNSATSTISFKFDNTGPSGLANLAATANGTTAADLTWTAATDNTFNHYEIWYGTNQSDVNNRTETATEFDNDDDANLATAATTATTISGLDNSATYYFKIWAIDSLTNESTIDAISFAFSVCGDDVVEGAEECEPNVALSQSCQSLGWDNGVLDCYPVGHASECRFDTSDCANDSGCTPQATNCSVWGDCVDVQRSRTCEDGCSYWIEYIDCECNYDAVNPDQESCGLDVGVCELGLRTCQSDYTWGGCENEIGPTEDPESTCDDGLDNDCDGLTDLDD